MTGCDARDVPPTKEAAIPTRTLNATAASLLGFLHDGPLSGWDLVRTAQASIGNFWSLAQSQVYRELAAMTDSGLVTAGARGRRDRRPFEITDAGRRAFADWIDSEPGPESIRMPLLLTVTFGRHLPPDRLAQFMATHRERHARQLAAYRARREEARDAGFTDPYALASLEFGIAYEAAALAWFDRTSSSLSDAKPPRRKAAN